MPRMAIEPPVPDTAEATMRFGVICAICVRSETCAR